METSRNQILSMRKRTKVSDVFRPLGECPIQAFFGRGVYVLGLIKWVLAQTGKADVMVSSYSTSEEFLRGFLLMRKNGLVRSSALLTDAKATGKTVHLWHIMSVCFDAVFVGENHSKVVLICNDKWLVSIVTSQNQTYGNRDESTIITTDQSVFRTLYDGYHKQCAGHSLMINL